MNDLSDDLCEPLVCEKVAPVCASLKVGISGVQIDYEHNRSAGPPYGNSCFSYVRISLQIIRFVSPY